MGTVENVKVEKGTIELRYASKNAVYILPQYGNHTMTVTKYQKESV